MNLDAIDLLGKEYIQQAEHEWFEAPWFIKNYTMSNDDTDKFSDYMDFVLDPERNEFELMKLSEFIEMQGAFTLGRGREIWFSGPAYFMSSFFVNTL